MLNINLGCGPNIVDNWVGVDYGLLPLLGKFKLTKLAANLGLIDKSYSARWPNIRFYDIRKHLPFANNSVDNIYCSHVLEHFEKYETENILKECYRILKRCGVLRIVLPDLAIFINNYKPGLSDSFCNNFFGWYRDQGQHNFFRFLIRDHKWMYDSKSFINLLENAGFKKNVLQKFKVGMVPNIDKLDILDYKDHSFYIESTK